MVNVAWYPVRALTAESLEKLLFDVMIDLQFRGFHVHALICDGLAVNRKLQKNLVKEDRRAGRIGYVLITVIIASYLKLQLIRCIFLQACQLCYSSSVID